MKKYLITLLGVIFLLPAFAYAGSYCVSFPTSGDSKFTKRDNNIGVRFRYDFNRVFAEREGLHGNYTTPTRFLAVTGAHKGSKDNRIKDTYTPYPYGTHDLCVYDDSPRFGKSNDNGKVKVKGWDRNGRYVEREIPISEVYLDVKWGGDCKKVSARYGRIQGDHRFEIYHRKGDLVNPFGCRRK